MRLLVVNSNTTAAVTDLAVAAARAVAAPGTTVVGATASFGGAIVGTRSEAAIAGHALLDVLAREADRVDAVLLAMSLDTGLWAARELLDVPVVGMTEAACLIACTLGSRFGLVTLGGRGAAPYREVVQGYGLLGRLAALEVLELTPAELLATPNNSGDLLLPAIAACVDAGAETVVLAGAVLGGCAASLAPRADVPLVDGITAGVVLAEGLARLRPRKPKSGSLRPTGPRATTGLSEALAGWLRGSVG